MSSESEETVNVNVERDAPPVNLMQIETGSNGYGIIVVIPALMPEEDFQTIVNRLTYLETRFRAVKELPIAVMMGADEEPGDEPGETTISTEG